MKTFEKIVICRYFLGVFLISTYFDNSTEISNDSMALNILCCFRDLKLVMSQEWYIVM